MSAFDFFFLSEESFPKAFESQEQIFYLDMLSRLSFYTGQVIAQDISSWTLIDFACKNGIKHVSSPIFNQATKKLPEIENKKVNKLINMGKHYTK